MPMNNQPYHLVDMSPWPLLSSMMGLNLFTNLVMLMYNLQPTMQQLITTMNLCIMMMIMYQWWRDVNRESTLQGNHTISVVFSIKMSMFLFITSEIFFFVSFFWTFFHSSLSPDIEIGLSWPPTNINQFNPYQIPLLNTIILLSSGFSLTWAHHMILTKNFLKSSLALTLTILLGVYFTIMQIYEYMEAPFTMSDSIFGSIFFMSTGFHGVHVIIGTLFLISMMVRLLMRYFNSKHHLGFEMAAWYWHFVDVVWIFLYTTMYWWIY
uniref:Cytochrome c oxidase subunit 3 n=1 Tax=Tinaminyssus melloi TaxID=105222 RepID=A0A5Q0RZ98_9ACAR|nr:cytochrome c oxidase subunit III [Tinaminyssus melloi]QGA47510.1 cytochrome c oxidase subunit III [Tinaminyssus melloi]